MREQTVARDCSRAGRIVSYAHTLLAVAAAPARAAGSPAASEAASKRGGQRPGRAPAAGGPVADHRPAGRAAEGPRDPDLPEGRVRSPAAGSSDDAPDAGLAEATACPPHTARQRNCPRPPAPSGSSPSAPASKRAAAA